MRVVFMGTPDFSVGTLRELAKAGHEIAGVISQPDKPKGRGKNLQPTPVKEAVVIYPEHKTLPITQNGCEWLIQLPDFTIQQFIILKK